MSKPRTASRVFYVVFLFAQAGSAAAPVTTDPLPSWHDGAGKRAIVDFVARVTHPESPDYVPPAERVAVFDNDGTLWAEQPMYAQVAFLIDRIRALAPDHPEWRHQPPFEALLEGNVDAVLAGGEEAITQLVMATHAGMTTDEFEELVGEWIDTARHPRFGRPYTQLVYRPMLELIDHLQANGFQVYIVSGGGVEFMRPWVERVYGVPRAHVVGSTIETVLERRGDAWVLTRRPRVAFVDDGPGKPVGIHEHIGRRPIAAFGNSDGDLEMLAWTTSGPGARLGMIVHHTDADREWAYDRQSKAGKLDKALDQARAQGWIVIDMKRDWRRVFPFENE